MNGLLNLGVANHIVMYRSCIFRTSNNNDLNIRFAISRNCQVLFDRISNLLIVLLH